MAFYPVNNYNSLGITLIAKPYSKEGGSYSAKTTYSQIGRNITTIWKNGASLSIPDSDPLISGYYTYYSASIIAKKDIQIWGYSSNLGSYILTLVYKGNNLPNWSGNSGAIWFITILPYI